MKRTSMFALAATLLIPCVSSLNAQTILTENFDGRNDNAQWFNPFNTFSSSGQTTGAADWLVTEHYGSGAPGTGFNGEGGVAALFFDKSAGSDNLRLRRSPNFDLGAVYDATKAHVVSFDFYNAGSDPTGNFRLFMTDGSLGSTGLDLGFYSKNRQVRNQNTVPVFDVTGNGFGQLKIDTWYRYELTINPLDTASDTYDLTIIESGVGAVVSETGLAFHTDIADITEMEFSMFSNTVTATAYFDNISVTAIPEPSTFALLSGVLALGSIMLRRRR